MVEMQIEEMRKGNEMQQEESQCSKPPTQQDIREMEEDDGAGVGNIFTPEAISRTSVIPITTGHTTPIQKGVFQESMFDSGFLFEEDPDTRRRRKELLKLGMERIDFLKEQTDKKAAWFITGGEDLIRGLIFEGAFEDIQLQNKFLLWLHSTEKYEEMLAQNQTKQLEKGVLVNDRKRLSDSNPSEGEPRRKTPCQSDSSNESRDADEEGKGGDEKNSTRSAPEQRVNYERSGNNGTNSMPVSPLTRRNVAEHVATIEGRKESNYPARAISFGPSERQRILDSRMRRAAIPNTW